MGPGGVVSVQFARWDEAARLYLALSHLDLGADAASLFDPALPPAPWVEPLRRAYVAAPGRLALHAVGLLHPTALREHLVSRRLPALADAAGEALGRATVAALDALVEAPMAYAVVPQAIVEPLQALRAGLWEQHGGPPPLTIVDCPALGWAGRAVSTSGGRVVAVALQRPAEHVLCQVLHEDVHAVTDPVVRASWNPRAPARDTAVGSPGFAQHQTLEQAAVEVGDALVAARAPAWSEAYRRWRSRVGAEYRA